MNFTCKIVNQALLFSEHLCSHFIQFAPQINDMFSITRPHANNIDLEFHYQNVNLQEIVVCARFILAQTVVQNIAHLHIYDTKAICMKVTLLSIPLFMYKKLH